MWDVSLFDFGTLVIIFLLIVRGNQLSRRLKELDKVVVRLILKGTNE